MLERLPEDKKVDYLILERSVMMSAMGSAVSLHTAVIPLLKQLGVWPEIERISKPMSHFCIKRADGSELGTVDYAYGDSEYVFSLFVSLPGMVFTLYFRNDEQDRRRETITDIVTPFLHMCLGTHITGLLWQGHSCTLS